MEIIRADRARMVEIVRRLLPSRSSFEPEDLSRDIAALGGVEQKSGDLGVGLGGAEVELVAIVLSQRLGIDREHAGDIALWNAVSHHGLHLAAMGRIGLVRSPSQSGRLEP